MVNLLECSKVIVETCANVKPGELVTIITDFNQSQRISDTLSAEAQVIGAEVVIVHIFPPDPLTDIPKAALAAIMNSDVTIVCTHAHINKGGGLAKVREDILRTGARLLQMHMLTEDIMIRTVPVDYDLIKKQVSTLSKLLPETGKLEITSSLGTNFTAQLKGRKIGYAWDGVCEKSSEWDAIPGGWIAISPIEGTSNGTLMFDGTFRWLQLGDYDDDFLRRTGRIRQPIRLKVKEGKITEIQGDWMATELKKRIEKADENAANLAEIGIGLNPRAKTIGFMLEDERVAGTIFVGIGRNSHIGGKIQSNFLTGLTLLNSTIKLDGETIIEHGILNFEYP